MNENFQSEQTKVSQKQNNCNVIVIIVAAVIIFAVSLFVSGNNPFTANGLNAFLNTRFNEDDAFIYAAEDLVSNKLKNPSSAIFNDAYVVEKDRYGRAIVYIDVTSENSLGGAARDTLYVCIQSVNSDGTYEYDSAFSTVSDGSVILHVFKELNHFGEPKP